MKLKYNRKKSISSSLGRIIVKISLALILIIVAIFLIEKVNFPSPEENYKIDITNEIKQLK